MDIGGTEAWSSAFGIAALVVFVTAFGFVLAEEVTELRKSKPMVIAAGLVWACVALALSGQPGHGAQALLRDTLLEYAELFLFLLAAMTFVNTMEERRVFAVLRDRIVSRGFGFRATYWILGGLSFVLSPVLDNLTTALVAGAVTTALGRDRRDFVVPTCVSVVVAANAGGAFSPFGDVTTLMVWQRGKIPFADFFALGLPSLVNWLVPALCMLPAVPRGGLSSRAEGVTLKPAALAVMALFALTIAATVLTHQWLHLPSFLGMMTGLGALQILGYFIRHRELAEFAVTPVVLDVPAGLKRASKPFDVFVSMKRVEWDTLMFFYGVMLCVGGLGALGYLQLLSGASYGALGPTETNILVGIASAIVDNIPIMFSVLSIDPQMSEGQWLLVTLTAGVGGALLSVGSAAGVALMGQARGTYTFGAHLRWSWAIALGYAASIWVHLLVNAERFAHGIGSVPP